MNKLSELNIKCLVNAPMMLDVISSTVDKLEEILNPYRDKLIKLLEKEFSASKYSVKDNTKKFNIYFERIDVIYDLCVNVNRRNNSASTLFSIDFGYTGGKSENVIYFRVNDFYNEEIYSNISNSFGKGTNDEEDMYLEFKIDETLSENKIEEYYSCFIEYVLLPVIEKYNQ